MNVAKHLSYALSLALALSVVLLDYSSIWITYLDVPPLALVLVSLLSLAVLSRRSRPLPGLFLIAGAVTLPYSLAPGHTLVIVLWEVVYVAVAAALLPSWARFALMAVLTWHGFTHSVSLALWGSVGPSLVSYGYAGIAAGLVFPSIVVAVRAATDVSRRRQVRLTIAAGAPLLTTGALFVALASGSRAVYLALAFALFLFCLRGWKTVEMRSAIGVLVVATVLVLAFDGLLPASPVRGALLERASVETQIQDVASSVGNVRWRLAMWHQSLSALYDHPFGTGVGSFSSVIHAYQRYPMLWSTSPHNYLVETLMTGGPLRLAILIMLVGASLVRALRSPVDWVWAPAIVAVWIPLLFDVAGSNPVYMAVAFGMTGVASRSDRARSRWITVVALLIGLVVATWWYAPCREPSCAIDRHRAFTPAVEVSLRVLDDDDERRDLVRRAMLLYPKTAKWYARSVTESDGQSEGWADFVSHFPFVSPEHYVRAVHELAELGACDRARSVAIEGLRIHGRYEDLYGQARLSYGRHKEIVQELSRVSVAMECP